jgi:2-phosphosulfolactate phosphatase
MPYGFHLTNSPAALALRPDTSRPMILLSTSGAKVLCEAKGCDAVYAAAACLRNYAAQGRFLAALHRKVAVIGTGTRGEFREEGQMCCAWIAEGLMNAGYRPRGEHTANSWNAGVARPWTPSSVARASNASRVRVSAE